MSRPLNRTTARNAALVNLLATPGLGSLMARRWVAGGGQLLMAVAGFCLMLGWFVKTMKEYYGLIDDQHSEPQIDWTLLKWGAVVFVAAWLWSLVTSIQIFRSVPKTQPTDAPPKLN